MDIEDTAENRALAEKYDVRSIPNMPLFYGGKEVDRIIGVVPKSKIVEMAKDVLKKNQKW